MYPGTRSTRTSYEGLVWPWTLLGSFFFLRVISTAYEGFVRRLLGRALPPSPHMRYLLEDF